MTQLTDNTLDVYASKTASGLKTAWLCFALLVPVYMFSMFYRMAPTVLALDIASDMHLATEDMAMLGAATMMSYGFMQLPSGLLADAFGGRKILCAFTAIVGGSTLWFGLTDSLLGVTAARFLTGLGIAVTIPCLTLFARWFPAGMYSRVSSLLFASGTCGTLLAATPLAIASSLWGWRAVMVCCGCVSLVLAAMIWLFVRDNPPHAQLAASSAANTGGLKAVWVRLKKVLCTRAFWPLCIGMTCLLLVYYSFAGLWLGPYLMQACGMTKAEAGNVFFLGTIASIPAMPILATISDKLRSRRAVMIPCALIVLAIVATLSFFAGRLSMAALVVLVVGFTSFSGMTAVALASGKELFPVDMVGTATGCLNMIPPMAAALHQKLFGLILAWRLEAAAGNYQLAYQEALYLNMAFLIAAVIALFLTRETYPKEA